jgi:hypothetical protein
MVELCSAQRGRIGKPITEYTQADLDAHRRVPKGCEQGCAVFCAYRDSQLDNDPVALARALVRASRESVIRWHAPADTKSDAGRRPRHRHLPIVVD